MLTCTPQSIFSWDFRVSGLSSGSAVLTFNFFSEQGSISLGGKNYTVRKHGPMSGHWTFERIGKAAGSARKPSAMFRSFEVRVDHVVLTVRANSAFTRRFDIVSGGRTVGTIVPAHVFTRRAFIRCSSEVPELAQLFAFWLAVISWRRSAKNSAG